MTSYDAHARLGIETPRRKVGVFCLPHLLCERGAMAAMLLW